MYLVDVLNVLGSDNVQIILSDLYQQRARYQQALARYHATTEQLRTGWAKGSGLYQQLVGPIRVSRSGNPRLGRPMVSSSDHGLGLRPDIV